MRAGPPILPLLALLVALPASAFALTAKVVVTARGTAPDDLTGFSVAPAGDVDGDGVPDLLASSMVSDASGDVRMLFLGPGRDAAWDRTIPGTSEFGYSIAGGLDLDGDGSPDFVAGSPNYSLPCGHNSCFARGRVTVLPKQALQITDAVMSAAGDPFTYQGFSITILPDFNGDGKPDLAAVSPESASGLVRRLGPRFGIRSPAGHSHRHASQEGGRAGG